MASFAAGALMLALAVLAAAYQLTQILKSTAASNAASEKVTFFAAREADHLRWVNGLSRSLLGAGEFTGQVDPSKCALGKWMEDHSQQAAVDDPEVKRLTEELDAPHRELHASAVKVLELKKAGKEAAARDHYKSVTVPVLEQIAGRLGQIRERYQQQATASFQATADTGKSARLIQLAFGVFGITVAIAIGLWLLRDLKKSLGQVMKELGESADRLLQAATQISSSSQALAQGASEQAASLEETSASSEQVNAMATSNSQNTQTASGLVAANQSSFSAATRSMDEMVHVMSEINESSGKVSKIIKVVDEIAFQTNILALNAAVEAARAGEAGLGFAVVADEVRSLAQRSAQAARDTASLIEESLSKSAGGMTKVDEVVEAIRAMAEQSEKLNKLIVDVAEASGQQAKGMQQISHAVGQMQQVTQTIAASAEQSAAATEDLTAQAGTLRQAVTRMGEMTGS